MKKIIIANNKGGVGKTTIAGQLAHSLAAKGHSVVGIDLDSQRNFTGSFENRKDLGNALDLVMTGKPVDAGLQPGEIGILSGHKDLSAQNSDDVLVQVRSGLSNSCGADFCVIDTPPSFSELVYGALLGADYLLVPIELKKFSLDGIEGVLEAFIAAQEHNPNLKLLGLLPSRFDAVKQVERDALIKIAQSFDRLLIPHAIRNRAAYVQAQEMGVTLSVIKTRSGREAGEEFGTFFDWLYTKLTGEH